MGLKLRSLFAVCVVAASVLVLPTIARSAPVPLTFTGTTVTRTAEFGFSQLTTNTSSIAGNLKFQLFNLGTQLGVRFLNNGPTASRIEEVYFYGGHLMRNGRFVGPTGAFTSFNDAVKPGNLPGFNPTSKNLQLSRFYAADGGSKGTGVTPGGYADFKFDLLPGVTLSRVIADLTNNLNPASTATPFYVGIHVQGIGTSGKSDSYLVDKGSSGGSTPAPNPSAVPLPSTVWAGLALMGATAIVRRWKRGPVPA